MGYEENNEYLTMLLKNVEISGNSQKKQNIKILFCLYITIC